MASNSLNVASLFIYLLLVAVNSIKRHDILYHSVFFSKNNRNRGIMNDDKQGQQFRKRSMTADYPRHQPHPNIRDRAPSAKFANKSLVNKIIKPSNPIPDVIASHEGPSSTKATDVKIANGKEVSVTANREINHTQGVKAEKYEISTSEVDHAAKIVEKRYENSTSKINHSTTQLNDNRTVVDANVQVHRPATDVSLNNESISSRFINEADLINEEKSNTTDPQNRPKRRSSITHSEKEALGTLDDVLRVFDDVDDNLENVDQTESKTTQKQPINSDDFDPRYESMADIKQSLNDQDDIKPNSDSNYSLLPSTLQQKQENKDLVPPTHLEQLYAKPIKPEKHATASTNTKKDTPKVTREVAPENPPVVPPKRFIEEDNYEIKFSPLRKTSPSTSLSKSLSNTAWANANEIPSPKRKPIKDKNDNFSLKRGQLSGPIPIITDDDYVEPPPDYDTSATMSSIGKSTDDSFNRDTWGSMTSSSTNGSRKVKKEFRPEVLKIIEKKKAEKEDNKENDGRKYDGLVNRSFRMRETPLERSVSKSSLKEEETDNKSDIEKDYTTIKDEADRWLKGYERMRASSEGKKELALKSKSGQSTEQKKEETLTAKVENGLPAETALPQTQAVDDMQVAKENIPIVTTKSEEHQSTKVTGKTKNKTKDKSRKHLEKNGEDDSDDENLIRLMETGVSSTEDSTDSSHPQPKMSGYVPRALRMSFGQSWNGIRKDRREWKSREMKHASAQASRKGGKSLSNRFDDQKEQLEMLF